MDNLTKERPVCSIPGCNSKCLNHGKGKYRKVCYRHYVENNITRQKKYQRASKKSSLTINGRYMGYKSNALKKSRLFDLTREQFLVYWKKPCDYCGDKIETIGLDRIDNEKGYTLENVVSCCQKCNFMKGTMGNREFLHRIKQITYHQRTW